MAVCNRGACKNRNYRSVRVFCGAQRATPIPCDSRSCRSLTGGCNPPTGPSCAFLFATYIDWGPSVSILVRPRADVHNCCYMIVVSGCSFSLCGRPIQRVCIVGVIVEARLHATNLVVMIDDGTGIISATYWFNEPGSCADHLALGNRVLVHGRLSTYRNEPQIQITSSGIIYVMSFLNTALICV